MVDTSGVVVKFPHAWMAFVDGRVLSKSTTRLAYLPALQTDPGATRGGHSGWAGEGRARTREIRAKTGEGRARTQEIRAKMWKAKGKTWKVNTRVPQEI